MRVSPYTAVIGEVMTHWYKFYPGLTNKGLVTATEWFCSLEDLLWLRPLRSRTENEENRSHHANSTSLHNTRIRLSAALISVTQY